MVLSFACIILIAASTPDAVSVSEQDYVQEETTYLVGIGLIALATIINSFFAVIMRTMSKINPMFIVLMQSIILVPVQLVIYIADAVGSEEGITRIFKYNWHQLLMIVIMTLVVTAGTYLSVVAMQNERSGFVAMCTYAGLIYAFLYDHYLFEVQISLQQTLGIVALLLLNIAVIVYRLNDPKSASKSFDANVV